jgi:hypothetical protein
MVKHQFPLQPERKYGLRMEYRIINQKAELDALLLVWICWKREAFLLSLTPFSLACVQVVSETTAASLQRIFINKIKRSPSGVLHAWEKLESKQNFHRKF